MVNKMIKKKIFAAILTVVMVVAGLMFIAPSREANAAVETNESADLVIGQEDFVSYMPNKGNGPAVDASRLFNPRNSFYDGEKFFVADRANNRVLIYNSLPSATNDSADVVIGQASLSSGGLANQGGAVGKNTLYYPSSVFSDGTRLFIADAYNHRVLIYNSIPETNNAEADTVIGQGDFTSNASNQGATATASTLNNPNFIFYAGKQLFISDYDNNRVLIYDTIPTANNAEANVVIGQQNMTSSSADQGGTASANTLEKPMGVWFNGKKLFIADEYNNRVLIYNSIPTANNASADVVIGQQNMTSGEANQGGAAAAANTLYYPTNVYPYGPKLLVVDAFNNRVLVFNSIPTASNVSADVVIGQQNMISGSMNQTGVITGINANTLYNPRGAIVADQKLIIGDYGNSRVLVYNSFGPQWTIKKNKSRTLSGDEKIKVKKKKMEFSGKKKVYKKGYVRVYRDGSHVKKIKIKNSGKWKGSFKDTGSAVKEFVIKYFSKSGALQMVSETYVLGIDRGNLAEATLKKASFSGPLFEKPERKNTGQKSQKTQEPSKEFLPWE